jgi:ABC-2 type transport system permease protein
VIVAAVVTLLGHHVRRHRVPLLPMTAGLALFQFLITRIAPAPNELNWISQIMAVVPPPLLALAGNDIGGISPGGFIALGYGHPFMLLLLSAWAVRVSSAALAGEIGRGTMDLLASRPIERWHHVAAGALAIVGGLTLLTAAAWTGTSIGLSVRDLGVTAWQVLRVAAVAALLFTAWGMLGLVVGATLREGGAAMGWTSGLIAGSFVLEYIARLWPPMSGFRPFSLFTYYAPQHIVRTGFDAHDLSLLAAVAALAFFSAIVIFTRRDL